MFGRDGLRHRKRYRLIPEIPRMSTNYGMIEGQCNDNGA